MTRCGVMSLFITSLCAAVEIGHAAVVEGCIRDAHGKPVDKAEICIERKAPDAKLETIRTGADGRYRIASLHAGTYTLRAETVSFGPFALEETQHKTVDLVLKPSSASIEFFDEPKFTVAGVTQNAYVGGHGPDTVKRSAEALSAAASALGQAPSQNVGADVSGLETAVSARPGDAALHHILAEAEARSGNPLAAVREFQRAAELEATETNLFDWGAELLTHGAPEPAAEVFERGTRRYPRSARMLLGAAVALYSHGDYGEAARHFFAATDLNPSDVAPYLFLAKAEPREITEMQGYHDRLARFVNLHPENAWANYYYASCLWKSKNDAQDINQVQWLLKRALRLNPKLAPAHLLLGDVLAAQQHLREAIASYEQATEADPDLAQAHYQLARMYRHSGNEPKAQSEMAMFERLQKQSAEQLARRREELPRFVVTLKSAAPN